MVPKHVRPGESSPQAVQPHPVVGLRTPLRRWERSSLESRVARFYDDGGHPPGDCTLTLALFQPLLNLIAGSTDRELAKQIQFLKVENEILCSKLPARVPLTPQEKKRLLKFGKPLKQAIKNLISIVSPRTFFRWLNGDKGKPSVGQSAATRRPGRPATPEQIRELIVAMAEENAWGYTRIHGELKKLGVKVSRSTVANILRAEGFEPGPKRGVGTWHEFVSRHAQSLWACDCFSKKVWTLYGRVELFVLFFIHIETRRVHIAGMTANPDRQWMMQQARNTAMFFADQAAKPRYLIRDNAGKFVPEFDAILKDEGVEVIRIPPHSPNMNPYAVRFIGSLKAESLDNFIVFGEDHLRYILSEYVKWYHESRPQQGMGNVPLSGEKPPEPAILSLADLVCEEHLGGLLKTYRRAA